jgi:hypothetical protein
MKKIMIVDYDKNISSYDFLDKLITYKIDYTNSYTDFKLKFENEKYDLCILSIENNIERDFILYDILALDKSQNILQLVWPDSQCFFDKDCKNCEKYNIKSIFCDKKEKIIEYITNFETSICEFTKLNI